jgi:hypothetical protein
MKPRRHSRLLWTLVVAAPVIFFALAALQLRIDAQTRSFESRKAELFLRSGTVLKKASLGYDALMADIYWTRAVQYYGSRSTKPDEYLELLDPLLDIATTLDPRLLIAYRFGAIFLSEPRPLGAGRTDLAVQLVKKGIAANPNEWHLYSDLGFLYYWRDKDYPDASAAYLAGSKIPDAPEWLKLMAARVAEKGGSYENSLLIWTEILRSTKDPKVRKKAQDQILELAAERDEEALDKLAEDYRQRFGRYPISTQEFVAAGMLRGVPVDPAGYPYIFGPDGKSKLDPASPIIIESPPAALHR